MTDAQKGTIADLRRRGLGCRKIAARLGLSENTVKAHLRRNGLRKAEKSAAVCKNCGEALPDGARKSRKFCGEACRRAWWKKHAALSDKKAWHDRVCAGCGKTFKSYGAAAEKRRFCSHDCYIDFRFKREAAKHDGREI